MAAAIEIYTRPGCGYCSAAKSLLTRKNAAFTEFNVSTDPTLRQPCATAPAPARHFRRFSSARPMSAVATNCTHSTAPASSTRCSSVKGPIHERRPLLYRRHGADAHRLVARAQSRAGHQVDPSGGRSRRRLRAHARGEQHDAAESQGAVRASGGRGGRSFAEGLSRAGGGTENSSAHRLAGTSRVCRTRGQPLIPDRTRTAM